MPQPATDNNILLELVKAMQVSARYSALKNAAQSKQEVCQHPEIGKLVEALGCDFLIATLELDQKIFANEYPNLTSISAETRRSMRDDVVEHVEGCSRCQLEAANEREWSENFDHFLRTQKKVVSQVLADKRKAPRGKPRAFTASS